jgi:hypothetical protein
VLKNRKIKAIRGTRRKKISRMFKGEVGEK